METSNAIFDTDVYRVERIAAMHGQYNWRMVGAAQGLSDERVRWQQAFRTRFDTLLRGVAPWECVPLAVNVSDAAQCEGYRRETVTFATRPGLRAFGYFLIPDGCDIPRPAMLCLPGHGVGVDGIVGLAEDEYEANFALQCVRHGYPTFALEQISFGHRRDAKARQEGRSASSCNRDSVTALMLGETISGWRVWDALRALDYLQTRKEAVDPDRLGVMGISGGGLTALFAAALDTRISASVVSGYFNMWAASILSVPHCVDNYVPGALAVCEMPDLAALVAPRALWVENGTEDTIFPLAAFEQAVAQARATYTTFGVPERFGAEVFEGGHRFHGAGAWAFLDTVFSRST